MRSCYIFCIVLLVSVSSFGQRTVEELILPQVVQGINSSATTRVPYVCKLKLNGFLPDKLYRYMARFVNGTTATAATGEGTMYSLPATGDFLRIANPNLGSLTVCDTFRTDGSGSYTGWFMLDAGTSAMFTPGSTVNVRISFNNTITNTVDDRVTTTSGITVINFGTGATDGSALRSTPAAGTSAKNFVLLYDNAAGAGRPVTGAIVESDGAPASGNPGYAPFYQTDVNGIDKAWGTIIPNNLAGGIKKIIQYNRAGNEVASRSSANGQWPSNGGGVVSTVSVTNGLSSTIVLDGNVVTLAPGAPVKLSQQIVFNELTPVTYGDADFALSATASSGLAVTYVSSDPAVATITGNTIHITGAGTVNITASQTGDDNFAAATEVVKQLQVNKADLTITAVDKKWVKGQPMPVLTVSYSGFKNGDDENDLTAQPQLTTTATPASTPGHYTINADQAASPNYTMHYVPGDMEVVDNSQSQTITFHVLADKTYGDADFNPGATVNSPLTVTYTSSNPGVATVVNNTIHIVGPGITDITAQQTGDATYQAAQPVTQRLTVRKASLIIKADDKTRPVGHDNPPLTIQYTGFVNNETEAVLLTQAAISTNATPLSDVGDYVIAVSGATSNNYDIEHRNGTLRVTPLPGQTISFGELPVKKYGDVNVKLNAVASSGLPVTYSSSNTSVAIIVGGTDIRIVGAGTSTITASQPGNTSWAEATPVGRTLTVQKVPLVVKAENKTKQQGEANPALTAVYTGFVNGDNAASLITQPTLITAATQQSVGGNYTIVAQGAVSNNYLIQHQNGELTILPPQGEGQDNVTAYMSAPGQLQVNVYAASAVKVFIQLYDISGARLLNISVSMKKGYNTYRLTTGNVTPGLYNLRVAGNNVMLKTKLMIQ